MRKIALNFFLILSISSICSAQTNQTESLTITTYYPSPYGVYKNLRLHPTNEPTVGVAPGVMFYNNTSDSIMYRNKTNQWVNLLGGGGVAGGWELNTTSGHVYNVNTGNIGIGTNNPGRKLEIFGSALDQVHDSHVLLRSNGETGFSVQTASNTNMWNPKYSAFRSRGTLTSPSDVGDGDTNLELWAGGYNSLAPWWNATAQIWLSADGAPTANGVPGRIEFRVTDPSATVHDPRTAMTIKSSGNVGIGTVNPQKKLDVNGEIHASGDICTDAGGGKCLSSSAGGGSALSDCVTIPCTVTVNWSNGYATCPAGYYVTGCTGSTGYQTTVYHPVFNGNGCVSIGGSAIAGQTVGYARCCK